MVKICHISDVHIRNITRHKEYNSIFFDLYKILKNIKPDLIVFCGDLAHNKTHISPEYVQIASSFLKNLADIAPTKLILGNHDKLYKNNNRLDAVSPIVNALNHPNLELFLKSGEYPFNSDITLNVLNVFDKENWVINPTNQKVINIALCHGSIKGASIDSGWEMNDGDLLIDTFKKYDFVFAGDIHKTNQIIDDVGKFRYPGSMITQNFGETNDKGFLLWDIKSKSKFTAQHVIIPNPYPFITLEIDSSGSLRGDKEALDIPENARIRITSDINLPSETIRRAIDTVKTKFKPDSVAFLNKSDSKSLSAVIDNDFKKEDLRSLSVQEKLIRNFLKDYSISEGLFQKIFNINKKFNQSIESKEINLGSISYEIMSFEWDNLFNYGSSNKINFENLNGIVGIFGKNFSGKSSIIDGLLYTIFNSITKNSRKKTNIINKDCDAGFGRVTIRIEDKIFNIERKSEKYIKKLHGIESVEAKTILDFNVISDESGEQESLIGNDRIETDKNISKYFGTFDDFLITSMSSQLGALSYIEKGSTERKEILARFLDVDFFGKKFDLANKESYDIRSLIKKLETQEFEKNLLECESDIILNKNEIDIYENKCLLLKNEISSLEKEIILYKQQINLLPDNAIDIDKINNELNFKHSLISDIQNKIKEILNKNKEREEKIQKVDEFISKFDIVSLKEKQVILEEHKKELDSLFEEISNFEKNLDYKLRKVELLKEVPCGSEYSHCKYIKEAYEAKKQISIINLLLEEKKKLITEAESKVSKLNFEETVDKIKKYELLLNKRQEFLLDLNNHKRELEIENQSLKIYQLELNNLFSQKQNYDNNKEKIDEINDFRKKLNIDENLLKEKDKVYNSCSDKLKILYRDKGFFEQKIKKTEEEKQELQKLRDEFEAYELFMKCVHPNGIAYDVIKNILPVINSEISNILSNIVDFEIFFENEDDKLELYMKKKGEIQLLPIEMCSGSQKNIAAMAIRLAFINISSLPKSNIFVFDEPGTSLDEENLEGFVRILDVIKTQFKCVILISHLDRLKDAVDVIIPIDNKDGFAYVNS